MKFGELRVAQATGAVLAHSTNVAGVRFKKGRVLSSADVQRLEMAGVEHVIAARLEPDDVAEDEAAQRLAIALSGAGIEVAAPFTGRCNLKAVDDGLLVIDRARLDGINLVHEALTVATLPAFVPVSRNEMLATVKVIPFAAPAAALEHCEELARLVPQVIRVVPFVRRRIGLIQTLLPGTKDSVLEKTRRVLDERLGLLAATVMDERRSDHVVDALTTVLTEQLSVGPDLVMIAGASAIVDRRDVIPAALEAVGGRIEHYGMPVDPGNLLLLGFHGEVPVLGLPGCAKSPKYNGLDPVLARLVAGIDVSARDIMQMGVGGLLKDYAGRPQPRGGRRREQRAAASRPRVVAVVLAAGESRRMGPENKLLMPIAGQPMITRVVDVVAAAQLEEVIVVSGHQHQAVEAALTDRSVRLVRNPDYAGGLSTSLQRALAALPEHYDAVLICLGDMPGITVQHIERLLAAFDPLEGRSICVPTCQGQRGNPVLWGRGLVPAMRHHLKGDRGARALLEEYAEQVCEVELDDPAILQDIDSPQAFADFGAASQSRTTGVSSRPPHSAQEPS